MPTETSDHPRGGTTGAETAHKKNITQGLKSRIFFFFFSFRFTLISLKREPELCLRSVMGNANNIIHSFQLQSSQSHSRFCPPWLACFCWWLLLSQQTDTRSLFLFFFFQWVAHLRARDANHAFLKGERCSNQAEWRANITKKSFTLRLARWCLEAAV